MSFREISKKLKTRLVNYLEAYVPAFHDRRATSLALAGTRLTAEQASEIEQRIAENPGDLKSRILLLGSYARLQFEPAGEEKRRRIDHIEWLIENHPEHPISGSPFAHVDPILDKDHYPRVKAAWIRQTERNKNNVATLANAARFFTNSDKELAERFLTDALKLKPSDREVRHQLAHLYSLWDGHEEQAVSELEKLCKTGDSEELFYELSDLPSMAFEAGQLDKAAEAAHKLLILAKQYRQNWNYGNAINKAHTVLGRIALRNGDLNQAKIHLEESAIDIATPQTTSFGPSLDLARDLAKAGEKECVLDYLDKFEQLCGVDNQWAFELRFEINSGKKPANIAEREQYEAFQFEHQLTVLRTREPSQRKEHLEELIKRTRSRVETWSRRIEQTQEQENDELCQHAKRTLARQQELLRNLQVLLPGSERPEEES